MARRKLAGQTVKQLLDADDTLSTADLNKLAAVGDTLASGTPVTFVEDVATTGTYADDDDAIVAAINSLRDALVAFGIMEAGAE